MEKLIIKNLFANYGKNQILNDISLELNQGEFICLCGPNGCGKSTLLSSIVNLNQSNFKITKAKTFPSINNIQIQKMKRKQCAKQIAYLQQNEYSMWDFNVLDFVLQGRFCHTKNGIYSKKDFEIAQNALKELQMESFFKTNIHNLSGGEFQKIRIARCLTQTPKFMLLDEPSSSLDYVFEPQLLLLLKKIAHEKNIGILITIHNINMAYNYADKIFLLPPNKKLICGTPLQIMNTKNLFTTFGVEFECKKTESFQLSQF